MSKKYPGGLITKTPVAPAGPFQDDAASGVWTLSQAAYWQEQGLWPIAGNSNITDFVQYNSTKDSTVTAIPDSVVLPYTAWFEVTDEYTLTVLENLVLDIDIWGGGGGGGSSWASSVTNGGAGGYSYARGVQLAAGTYKFVVGAGGRGGIFNAGESQATMASLNEAFGNGGLGTQANHSGSGNNNGGCGGGFSGIFSTSTAFANALFISGGGGGAGTGANNNGGQGGASTGADGKLTGLGSNYYGRGGTQSAGGIGAPTGSIYTDGDAGSQLQGGDGGISSIIGISGGGFGGGGGGGGYYGGGSAGTFSGSGMGGGGGGSGYTTTALTMTSSGAETATVKKIPTTKATGAPSNTSAGYGGATTTTHPAVDGYAGAIKFTITGTF